LHSFALHDRYVPRMHCRATHLNMALTTSCEAEAFGHPDKKDTFAG
jgi:hypothetical protein